MAMTNADCIERLQDFLDQQEGIETFILEDDARDPEDLREVEKDIEALKRAIRALQRTARKRKEVTW